MELGQLCQTTPFVRSQAPTIDRLTIHPISLSPSRKRFKMIEIKYTTNKRLAFCAHVCEKTKQNKLSSLFVADLSGLEMITIIITCWVVCCFWVLEMRVASCPSLESWLELGEFCSEYPLVTTWGPLPPFCPLKGQTKHKRHYHIPVQIRVI